MAYVIGLTGGVASGKSTASRILKELGAIIIDADEVARKVVEKGKPALDKVKEYFGDEIILEDGNLNRKKLGSMVFSDYYLLKKLNEITHPYIIKEIINEINWYKTTSNDCVLILDAALLIEMNLTYLVDEVWLICVPEDIQLKRLTERENINIEDAKRRIDAQMPLYDKKQYANIIIENSKSIDCLKVQLKENFSKVI